MPPESDQVPAAGDGRPASSPAVFSVHPERVDGVYRLGVSGELDLASHKALKEEVERAEASEANGILLDLSDLTFIDSTGMAVLVRAHERSLTNGIPLRFSPVDGQVREMLELTGLMAVFDFTD
jgi:anti-sigma B factor antagonist